MSLTVNVYAAALKEVLGRLYAATDDLSPVMSAIGMEMESRISVRFESESDPLGVKWIPWKEETKKRYPKDGNRRLLDCFGDMLGSLNHTFDDHSAAIGFGDPKAAYHEWGTKHMGRRGMLFADPDAGTLAPDDEAALLEIVTALFEQSIR